MHWQTIIELAGYIALAELTALLPAWLLWRVDGSIGVIKDKPLTLVDHKDFQIHGAETVTLCKHTVA